MRAQRSLSPVGRTAAAVTAVDLGLCGVILALTLLVYRPALPGELLWDDPAHVTRADLRDWDGLRRICFEVGATQEYYPVLHGALWLEYRLWGDSTTGYHLLNIFLHATNCCLLAFLLRKIWQKPPEIVSAWTAPPGTEWLAAFLFAVHPVAVESVAWITEQKNTLSTAFYLLAASCFLDFSARRRAGKYWLAFGLFLLALGAKTMTVTLPAALLVVLWWQHGRLTWRRDVVPLLPWFVAAIAGGLLTSHVERTWVGAEGGDYELSFLHRGLLAARILWFSLGKLVWPADLTFFYPRWDVAVDATGWIAFLIAAVVVTAGLWFFRNRSRGPLAGWLLYGGTLFPVLGFFNVFSFSFSYVADHYQYLAIPVVVSAAAAAIVLSLGKIRARARAADFVAIGAVVIVLGVLAHRQSRLYRDDETLFRANIAVNPTSWMGHHILAQTLAKKSPANWAEAVALYRRALELKTPNPDSHYKLGYTLAQRRETRDEAIAHYEEALRQRPAFPEAHNSLAVELAAMPGRLPEAIAHYREAIRLRPRFYYAHVNLAQALAQVPAGQAEAIDHLEEALRLKPDYVEAHNLLGVLLAQSGSVTAAKAHWNEALRLDPSFEQARQNLRLLESGQPR